MAGWVKKGFESVGVTEYPPGDGLDQLQLEFGGKVILALDVSGSMARRDAGPDGNAQRLATAFLGCHRFIDEAVEARYSVGLILWNHDVVASVAPEKDPQAALDLLTKAESHGRNDAVPFLDLAHRILMDSPAGDMVVAIFGDGDLGNPSAAKGKAAELVADNIRILTCGLGEASAESLAEISTEGAAPRAATSESIVESIADMARGLKQRGD